MPELVEGFVIIEGTLDRLWIVLASLFALSGVGLGAFGAHGLRSILTAEALGTLETGVRYQMYHALALLAVGVLIPRWEGGTASLAGWLFVAGIVLFSGSLYVLAFTGLRYFGAIAPLGGACLLAGSAMLAVSALRG